MLSPSLANKIQELAGEVGRQHPKRLTILLCGWEYYFQVMRLESWVYQDRGFEDMKCFHLGLFTFPDLFTNP